MAGRTYRYYRGTPMYPFGYGLSYSVFEYSNLVLSSDCIHPGESVIVTVGVINRGPYGADEVSANISRYLLKFPAIFIL